MEKGFGAVIIVLGGLTAGCDLVKTVMALVSGGDGEPSVAMEAEADQSPQSKASSAQTSAPEKAASQTVAINSTLAEPRTTIRKPTAVQAKASPAALPSVERTSEPAKTHVDGESVAKREAEKSASDPQGKDSPEEASKAAPSARQQRPRVRTGSTFASGEVDATSAHRALRSANGSLVACYGRALKENPESSGTITVAVQIGAEGQVTGAKGRNAPGLPSHVTQCMLGVVRGLKFPLKNGSKSGTLSVPVTFTPG